MRDNRHAPDYAKNRTADVIPKGWGKAVPDQQWQINMNLTPRGIPGGGTAFMPIEGRLRPTPHKKTNECDH